LDVSDYGGHGHAEGRQGRAGHMMRKSDADRQSGSFIPQNMYSRDGGTASDDDVQGAADYGSVDDKTD